MMICQGDRVFVRPRERVTTRGTPFVRQLAVVGVADINDGEESREVDQNSQLYPHTQWARTKLETSPQLKLPIMSDYFLGSKQLAQSHQWA